MEALLFVSGAPLKFKEIGVMLNLEMKAVRELTEELQKDLSARKGGLRLVCGGEKAQLTTTQTVAGVVDAFLKSDKEGDLSRAALETISVIAYRGPVTRAAIEEVRGVNCSFALRSLLIRGLIERTSHPDDARTFVYSVSMDFLRHMGLGRIEELPHYEELSQAEGILKNTQLDEEARAD